MPSVNRIYFLVGILSGLLWGMNDVFTNLLGLHVAGSLFVFSLIFALILALLQDGISSCAIFCSYFLSKNISVITKDGYAGKRYLFFAAVLAGPLGLLAGILGIKYAGAVYAGAITACYPIIALLGARFFLQEQLSNVKYTGILFSVIALIAISIEGGYGAGVPKLLGIMFSLIATFGWGVESILFTKAYRLNNCNSSSLLAIRQFYSALLYLFILSILLLINKSWVVAVMGQLHHIVLLTACVASACISYVTYYFVIKKLGASLGTMFNSTFIFWSALISLLVGLSHVTMWFWLWALVMLGGIFLSYHSPSAINLSVARQLDN